MLKKEIKNIKATPKDLVKFGFTVGGVLILIGVAVTIFSDAVFTDTIAPYLFAIGGIILILGIVKAPFMKGIFIAWMTFALILGWIISNIIITFVFFLAVFPISLIAKLFGKKFLELDFQKDSKTYWNYRNNSNDNSDIEKQY